MYAIPELYLQGYGCQDEPTSTIDNYEDQFTFPWSAIKAKITQSNVRTCVRTYKRTYVTLRYVTLRYVTLR